MRMMTKKGRRKRRTFHYSNPKQLKAQKLRREEKALSVGQSREDGTLECAGRFRDLISIHQGTHPIQSRLQVCVEMNMKRDHALIVLNHWVYLIVILTTLFPL